MCEPVVNTIIHKINFLDIHLKEKDVKNLPKCPWSYPQGSDLKSCHDIFKVLDYSLVGCPLDLWVNNLDHFLSNEYLEN